MPKNYEKCVRFDGTNFNTGERIRTSAKVLSIDPSSTAVGVALLTASPTNPMLLGHWLIKPSGRQPTHERAHRLARSVVSLAEQEQPNMIVCEITSGMTYTRARASSLSALGFAQGMIVEALMEWDKFDRLWLIDELQWTGQKKKEVRAKSIHAVFPKFGAWAKEHDKGLDVTDAIGLADWFVRMNATYEVYHADQQSSAGAGRSRKRQALGDRGGKP